MINAVKSEFRKFFSTRMWWGMAIVIFLSAAGFAALFAFLLTLDADPEVTGMAGDETQIANSVYTAGLTLGYTLTFVIGILQIGSEYRHKTVTSTFLSAPKRGRVMLAKVISLLGIGGFYGLVSLVGSVAFGALVLSLRGADPFPSPEILRSMALMTLALGLWALIGLGVGILIPNQVAAMIIGIAVVWIVEPIAGVALSFWEWGNEHVVQFLPQSATGAIVEGISQAGDAGPNMLSWWAGTLVLLAYAAILAGVGSLLTMRKDIS